MRECIDRNVSAHGTLGRQRDVTISRGKTRTGRTVWKDPVTIRESGQIAREESGSSRQTLSCYSRAVKRDSRFPMEAASAKKPRAVETETTKIEEWINTFENRVDGIARELREECKREPVDSLLCLTVVNATSMLTDFLEKNGVQLKTPDFQACRRYVISEMTPLYSATLGMALQTLQDQIAAGGGWACFLDLETVTRYPEKFNSKALSSQDSGREVTLKEVWRQHVLEEMIYLNYLKDFPNDRHSAQSVLKNIRWLVSEDSPVSRFDFISVDEREYIMEQAGLQYDRFLGFNTSNSDTGRKKEKCDESRENVCHGSRVTDMMVKRKHYDQLIAQHKEILERFVITPNKQARKQFTVTKYIRLLKELKEMHDKHNELVGNRDTPLRQKLKITIPRIIKAVKHETRKYVGDDDQLKAKVRVLVKYLEKEGFLAEEWQDPYPGCTKLQDMLNPSARMSKITYHQYGELITDIYFDIDTDGDFMEILARLKRLIEDERYLTTRDGDDTLQRRLNVARNVVYGKYFLPVLYTYNEAKKTRKCHEEIAIEMRQYKERLIESISYVSLILNESKVPSWRIAACFAWSRDIDRLRDKSSFNEGDVVDLLHLKDLVSNDLQNNRIRNHLQDALARVFSFMQRSNPDEGLVTKVAKLSEWVKDLDRNYHIDRELWESSKKWRKR